MAKKVAAYNTNSVVGAPINAAAASTLLQALFVGLNSGGEIILADRRNSASRPPARGALLANAQLKDPKGNVLDTPDRGAFTFEGNLTGMTDSNGAALIPGIDYFLESGGGITKVAPTLAGDVRQRVGYATTTDELVIAIGPPAVN